MESIKLNNTEFEFNNIYYISPNGDDIRGDGSYSSPFATYKKAFENTLDGDLIYFKKGNYSITSVDKQDNTYAAAFLYDKNKQLTIYAEPYTYITINNPQNSNRDTHAIAISNINTKIIGFIIDYNVNNKSSNYSRSIFGRFNGYARGTISNCHFIIRSVTSFSYANDGNTLKCINCQFDILNSLERAYSGKTTFEKCTFNISTLNTDSGVQNIDNKFNVVYDSKYESAQLYHGYGACWRTSKFLVKQNNNYYSIKNGLLELGQSTSDNQIEKWYENYGICNINILMQCLNNKEIYMTKNEVTNIWQTVMKLDFNKITNSVKLIEEYGKSEANKIIKYDCDKYRIYDLLDDEFEVVQYIPNASFLPREDVNTKLQIKGKRKNIFNRFNLQNPELLVYIDNKDVESASLEIEGIKQEDFKYQIKLDDEIIQDYSQFDHREINKEFMVPKEKIDAAKNGNKTHILTVTMQDTENNETMENCDINIKTQRSFSRYFKPNADYVHISGLPKVLSEITIQIIKRAKNENEFTCITNNTLVSMSGNELKICGNSFEGWIYEVRVWQKGKEQQWTGIPLKGDEEGLIALYRMNELEGNVCFDSTDNKLHGIYLGTEWSEIVPTGVKEGTNSKILIKDENAIVPQGKDYPYEYKITAPYMMINEIHENDMENDIIEFEVDKDEYRDIKSINLIE